MKILLVQLGSIGDCLLVTTIAKQIKEIDYPECCLSWLILDKCKQVIENNPYVDEIIPVFEDEINTAREKIGQFIDEIREQGKTFDKIIITDNYISNKKIWFGPLRSMYHRVYQELTENKIKISPETLIYLTEEEKEKADEFARKHNLDALDCFPILFECLPQSGQSTITPERALAIASQISEKYPDAKFILSSKEKIVSENKNIIDGSELSYRETAQLLNHCKLLVGVSSGITWLNTSNWSDKIPTIQYIKRYEDYYPTFSASMLLDFKNLGEPTDNLIELYCTPNDKNLTGCISDVLKTSFQEAKKKYPLAEVSPVEYFGKMYIAKNCAEEKTEPKEEKYKEKKYLFGFIPLTFDVKEYNNKKKISLFGIPILKEKLKEGVNRGVNAK